MKIWRNLRENSHLDIPNADRAVHRSAVHSRTGYFQVENHLLVARKLECSFYIVDGGRTVPHSSPRPVHFETFSRQNLWPKNSRSFVIIFWPKFWWEFFEIFLWRKMRVTLDKIFHSRIFLENFGAKIERNFLEDSPEWFIDRTSYQSTSKDFHAGDSVFMSAICRQTLSIFDVPCFHRLVIRGRIEDTSTDGDTSDPLCMSLEILILQKFHRL